MKGAGKKGFDSQSYNDFGPFVQLSFLKILDSADNKCKCLQISLLIPIDYVASKLPAGAY